MFVSFIFVWFLVKEHRWTLPQLGSSLLLPHVLLRSAETMRSNRTIQPQRLSIHSTKSYWATLYARNWAGQRATKACKGRHAWTPHCGLRRGSGAWAQEQPLNNTWFGSTMMTETTLLSHCASRNGHILPAAQKALKDSNAFCSLAKTAKD